MEEVGRASLMPRLWSFVLAKDHLLMLDVEHTSRFHVRCGIMYELLDLLGDDLGAVPC